MLIVTGATVVAADTGALDIGSRLELFVDPYLIDHMDRLRLKRHTPRPAGVAIRFDEPWEGEFCFGHTIIEGNGKYHMITAGFVEYPIGWSRHRSETSPTMPASSRSLATRFVPRKVSRCSTA